jgi:uncharacterized coiled-coil DUF342 family protein
MRKILILFLLVFSSSLSCTVVDTELFELILEIKNQNKELLDEVKSLQAKSDSLINELKKSAEKQEEILKKVTDLQAELAKIISQIGLLNEKLTSQDADLEAVKSQLADLQKKYEGILVQLEQLQKLSQILAEIEKLKSQLTDLNGKYQVVVNTLAQNQQALDALKSQVTALQAQLAQNLEKISQLTSQLGEQGVDIEKILAQIEELKTSCEEIKALLGDQLSGKSPIPTNGLVGWWPFNGNANDESGNGNNGVVNDAFLVSNRKNSTLSAYRFDGINDFIETNFKGIEGNNKRTISLWVKTTADNTSDGMAAVSLGPDGLGTRFDAFFNFKKVGATANIGGAAITYKTPKPVNDGEWHHYIFMVDTDNAVLGNIKVYQDGLLLTEIISNFNSPEVPINTKLQDPLVFGKTNYIGIPAYFEGEMDEVAIWNRPLSTIEITKIYKDEGF